MKATKWVPITMFSILLLMPYAMYEYLRRGRPVYAPAWSFTLPQHPPDSRIVLN